MQPEFNVQIFNTWGQWEKGGLRHRLDLLDKDSSDPEKSGLRLYKTPGFHQWISGIPEMDNLSGLAADECGRLYFARRNDRWIYRHDPGNSLLEKIFRLRRRRPCGAREERSENEAGVHRKTKIVIGSRTLWILGPMHPGILAVSRENHQIKTIIDDPSAAVDIALDEREILYVLHKKKDGAFEIQTRDRHGLPVQTEMDASCLQRPVDMAAGGENVLYVLDKGSNQLLLLTNQGDRTTIRDLEKLGAAFIAMDRKKNIYVADSRSGFIHQFDQGGNRIGVVSAPGLDGPIRALAVDSGGGLYASGRKGIAVFEAEKEYSTEEGFYYTRTLDSGIDTCQWHGLSLEATLPEGAVVEVYYHSSETPVGANKDAPCGAEQPTRETIDTIECGVSKWTGPAKNPADMLFREETGRYLRVKLKLLTVDKTATPEVTRMKVLYPRRSYLRYLPAVYQEDPAGKEFLERFLSMFETVFHDLENEIGNLSENFDPEIAPPEFLEWLASWLNLGLEEEWDPKIKRKLLGRAAELHRKKGTAEGISTFIELIAGRRPVVLEHSRMAKPLVLGKGLHLGIDSMVARAAARGFRLGVDSILGLTEFRHVAQLPEDPFLAMSHRFTVLMPMSRDEFKRKKAGIKRVLDEQKPAHTDYNLSLIDDAGAGCVHYVGVSTRLADFKPFRLGITSVLGEAVAMIKGEDGVMLERNSRLTSEFKLI